MKIPPNDKTGSSTACEVCRMAKLKRSPHSNPLPTSSSPFHTIHMDLLQITPVSRGSFKYVLVLIDDFSRFNRIYLLQKKDQSESRIMSFVKEIKNQIDVTPAILHTNRGGEFGSLLFKKFLLDNGISLEQGPANSPQTNGLAERFNRTLLIKICCMLAQCNVPLNYWDETAKYASTLINMLPSVALEWRSPMSILVNLKSNIEQVRHVHSLIPFGLKVFVHNQSPSSKILPPSKPLLFLGYEPRSDAMRFLDPISRRIVVSRDYSPSVLSFAYNSKDAMRKLPSTFPSSCASEKDEYVSIHVPEDKSSDLKPDSPQKIKLASAFKQLHLTNVRV
jgi:transposase InsO family protein